MSPEQIRGDPIDYRSDVFFLGISLHLIATCRRPFESATVAKAWFQNGGNLDPLRSHPRFQAVMKLVD